MTDTRIEQYLDAVGVTWKFDDALSLASIDMTSSLNNQARTETIMNDVVAKYHKKMREGVEFPPIVLTEDGMVLDGNHRVKAALLDNLRTFPAYVVSGTDQQIDVIIASANDTNGEGTNDGDRLEHALHLVYVYGYSYKDAGAIVGLNTTKVSDGYYKREGAKIAVRGGIGTAWEKLADSSQVVLSRAGLLDPVFLAAVKVAGDKGYNTKTVQALVAEVKKHRSSDEQLASVEKFSKKNKTVANYGGLSTPAGKMMAVMAQCAADNDVVKAFLGSVDRLTPERRRELRQAADAAIQGLRKLREEL